MNKQICVILEDETYKLLLEKSKKETRSVSGMARTFISDALHPKYPIRNIKPHHTFRQFLMTKYDEDSPIGDLAKDILNLQMKKPDYDVYEEWVSFIKRIGVGFKVYDALEEAWILYQIAIGETKTIADDDDVDDIMLEITGEILKQPKEVQRPLF